MGKSLVKIFTSMWLGIIWLILFMIHFFVITAKPVLIEDYSLFDQIVYLSCFLIHGLLDRFIFDFKTVLVFALQFGFWWIVGIVITNAFTYLRVRRKLAQST